MMNQSTNQQDLITGYWAIKPPTKELQAVSRLSRRPGFNRVEMSGVRCDTIGLLASNAIRTRLLNMGGKSSGLVHVQGIVAWNCSYRLKDQ